MRGKEIGGASGSPSREQNTVPIDEGASLYLSREINLLGISGDVYNIKKDYK